MLAKAIHHDIKFGQLACNPKQINQIQEKYKWSRIMYKTQLNK